MAAGPQEALQHYLAEDKRRQLRNVVFALLLCDALVLLEVLEALVAYFGYLGDVLLYQVEIEHFRHEFPLVLPGVSFGEDHSFAGNQLYAFDEFLLFGIGAYLFSREQLFPKTRLNEDNECFIEDVTNDSIYLGTYRSFLILGILVQLYILLVDLGKGYAKNLKRLDVHSVSESFQQSLVMFDEGSGFVRKLVV